MGAAGKEVVLAGDVKTTRHAAKGDVPSTTLDTRTLKIFPDEEKGSTNDPVKITKGASVIHGTGLETDNRTGITVMHGRVTGTLHSNRTEKP